MEYGDEVFTKDVVKKVTLGDPDGEAEYVESLDLIVPTFVNPRRDLLPPNPNSRGVPRLKYHVPFQMRGPYKLSDLPSDWASIVETFARTTSDGYVICEGEIEKGTKGRNGIEPEDRECDARAVNRSMFCAMHGGALHPADKKMSDRTNVNVPERVAKLDRVQKVLQGFIKIEELTEEEIEGSFVYRDVDTKLEKIESRFLGPKIQQAMTKELHIKLNEYLRNKAPTMLKVVTDIAENPIAEEADRLKAAIWAFERVGGKTPDVVVHGKTEAPYEQILGGVQSGSREDYRKSVASTRGNAQNAVVENSESDVHDSDGRVIDAELVGDDGQDWYGEDYRIASNGNRADESLDLSQVDFGEYDDEAAESFKRERNGQFTNGHDAAEWNSRPNRNSPNGASVRVQNRRDAGLGEVQQSQTSPGEDPGIADDDARRVAGIQNGIVQRKELSEAARSLKAARDRVRKRRFAAKATGSNSLDRQPYTIEYRPITSGREIGKHRVVLWKADQLNERVLNRIAKDQYEFDAGIIQERLAGVLDAQVQELSAKMAPDQQKRDGD